MKISVLQFLLPTLVIGALGGYFFAEIRHSRSAGRSAAGPRAAFLSSEEDSVDYEKLARVCLAVSERNAKRSQESPGLSKSELDLIAHGGPAAKPEEVIKTKERLDLLMSSALELGSWTRLIAFRARQLMGDLPPADAAEFAQLFSTVVQQGDLKVAPGVWVPEAAN